MTQLSPQPRQAPAGASQTGRGPGIGARVRNWFLTGVVVAGPLAVTAYIVWWFINTIDNWVRGLVPMNALPDSYLPFRVPGLGVVLVFLGLTFLGFLAANLAGRSLIRLGESILARMPVIRSIYKSVKQIFETVFSQTGTTFRKVGLIEFPKGAWSIVFISTPPTESVAEHLARDETYVSVFLPCTPNPTTGFYFYLPAREVMEVAMTPDEALKLIMSCGVIQPDAPTVLAAQAESSEPAAA